MIWREIKIGVFTLALCILAAVATEAIYEHASSTMTSAWLLVPLFLLIAVAITASELLFKKAEANVSVQINPASTTWPPGQMPAIAIGELYILSFSVAPPQALSQAAGAGVVATNQAIQSTEQPTYL